MAVSTYPSAAAGVIKNVQRGVAASAGTITITSVDIAKSFVRSFSNGSAGSVGGTGTDSGTINPSGGQVSRSNGATTTVVSGSYPSYSGTRTFVAGTTALTTAVYGIVLTNATTITASGACYWEVVEYN